MHYRAAVALLFLLHLILVRGFVAGIGNPWSARRRKWSYTVADGKDA